MQRLQRLPAPLRTGALMVLSSALLFPALGAKSVWLDERIGAHIADQVDFAAMYRAYRGAEVQPPLNNIVLVAWTKIFGSSDAALRVPSVLFTVASVGLFVGLAKRLAAGRPAWTAAYLMAISPFLLLFGRMNLYYAPALFFTIASALTLLRALDSTMDGRPDRRAWVLHGSCVVALLLTNYTAIAYIVCETACGLLVAWRKVPVPGRAITAAQDRARLPFITTTLVATVAFALWAAVDADRLIGRNLGPRPRELLGLVRLALDAVYPLYAWGVGATIFPWHPAGVAAAIVVAAGLFLGARRLIASLGRSAFVSLAFFGTLAIAVLAYQLYVRGRPFETIPTRSISTYPFFLLTLALGIDRLPRVWRGAAVVVLTAAAAVAAINYHSDRQFHNGIYAVPSREMATNLVSGAGPNDVVIADADTGVGYYLEHTAAAPCWIELGLNRRPGEQTVLGALGAHPPGRIWRVRLGRDGTEGLLSDAIDRWTRANYDLLSTRGYVPQDRTYARLKQLVQGRGGYRYKATVALYERSVGSGAHTTPCGRKTHLAI